MSYLLPLLAGDRLEVRAADGLVRIRLGEEGVTELGPMQSPFTVPMLGAVPTVWGNLTHWAGSFLTDSASSLRQCGQLLPLAGARRSFHRSQAVSYMWAR